ncbi:MAG: hypothetical protein K9M80_06650 [Candidatus Marinimicrobia bacterium]|nr:hypothetical protein [Candidatus Neomarinimicrobiota bacterium]
MISFSEDIYELRYNQADDSYTFSTPEDRAQNNINSENNKEQNFKSNRKVNKSSTKTRVEKNKGNNIDIYIY